MKKPKILVIDTWLPTPDRDSASLRMVNLLAVLEHLASGLTFGAGDPPEWRNPQNWIPWTPSFQNPGMTLLTGYAAIDDHLQRQGKKYDVVLLSRLSIASRYLRTVRYSAPQAAIVFDTTDLHFLRGFRGAKITGKVHFMRSALRAKQEELSIARQADCTLVVSPVEKKILEEECPGIQVHLVSNIQTVYGSTRPFSERSGLLFVGSFPHHPNVDGMAYFYNDIYPLLRSKLPGITITIIGSDPPHWLRDLCTNHFIVTDYVANLEPYFRKCRLSIAPLRYGAGVKGKVLLSLGYGVPVIASPIAAEGIPAVNGRDMFIAETSEEFSDKIRELYTNEALWTQFSNNGLNLVDTHFSFSAAQEKLTEVFRILGVNHKSRKISANEREKPAHIRGK